MIIQRIKQDKFLQHNAIYFIGTVSVAFLNYLYHPVMGRLMKVADFGEVQAFLSFLLIFGVFTGFFKNVITTIVANLKNDQDRELVAMLQKFSLLCAVFLFLIPIIFGFLTWGGFHKQVQPTWYPESWFEAKQIIENDKSDFKILFLPWHGYYSLEFNNNLVSGNPARRFFGQKIISSRSVEMNGIYDQESDKNYLALDELIRNENIEQEKILDIFFNEYKIKYIVYSNDLIGVDNLNYKFLSSAKLEEKLDKSEISVFEIKP